MKPVLLKAGIPLAVSIAGFVIARIVARKSSVSTASSKIQITNGEDCDEDDHAYAEEILELRRRVEEMQDRELQLEKRFVYYQGLKDQEVVLTETNRFDFLEKEVSLVQAESQRFECFAKEYTKLLRLDEFLKSQNEKLCKRAKKLLRKSKEHSWIMRKQCLQIQCKETEISRNMNEIKELKLIIEELQREKNEVLLAASKVYTFFCPHFPIALIRNHLIYLHFQSQVLIVLIKLYRCRRKRRRTRHWNLKK